jgi:CubicO group peptidase (beta-lactamase class C family)
MTSSIAIVVSALLAATAPLAAQTIAGVTDSLGPAARRLRQLIGALESGSSARIRSFIRDAYAPELSERTNEDRAVQSYMRLYDRSRGLELDSLRATATEAAALLRSRLTGWWEQLSIRIEPKPPHRLVGVASFTIDPPKHPLAGRGASDRERVGEIERVARRLSEVDAFSGVVLLAKGDSVLYVGAFGDADRERRIPIRPDTPFQLASITKTFITVAIAKLVEQRKLDWNDPLGKFFPDFPLREAREMVRIKHLVTHTSGLREFQSDSGTRRSMNDYVRTVALAQDALLLYEPGTRSTYTNGNFLLLAKIVELASDQPFYAYIRNSVFRAAGMDNTDFLVPGSEPPRIAVGYEKEYTSDAVRLVCEAVPRELSDYPAPHCCAYSTAHDLLRFASALRSGRILLPATVDLLFSAKPEAGNWGYGFDILNEDRRLVGHGGSWVGQSNSLDMFLRIGYTVVILSNYTDARSPLRELIAAVLP